MRVIKFLGFLLGGMFVRRVVAIAARLQREESVAVGKWFFGGSSDFIRLVREAMRRMEDEDPDIIKGMGKRYVVTYSPRRLLSRPTWGSGGISDAFVAWGSDGLMAAWIYMYYHHVEAAKVSYWDLTLRDNVKKATVEAYRRTYAWLRQHGIPSELCEVFEWKQPEEPTNGETTG